MERQQAPFKANDQTKEVEAKLQQTRSLLDDGFKRDRLAIKDSDDRPARPDSWNSKARNGLMFNPDDLDDGVVTRAEMAEGTSRMAPRSIVYENTKIPLPHVPERPPLRQHQQFVMPSRDVPVSMTKTQASLVAAILHE